MPYIEISDGFIIYKVHFDDQPKDGDEVMIRSKANDIQYRYVFRYKPSQPGDVRIASLPEFTMNNFMAAITNIDGGPNAYCPGTQPVPGVSVIMRGI